jgi:hypothetical protein
MTESNKIKCPICGNEDIAPCRGGTCYKPNEWAMQNIKYICTNGDCLCEFGDNGITEWDNPKNKFFENTR